MCARPLVLAHRGASAYAPENTFAAFDLALEMNAPALETDVRRTADGQLVLLHDERVDRTTDGQGRVADLTLAELKGLDAGSWLGAQFAGQTVPTVEEFLLRYGGRVGIRLEVKAPEVEEELFGLVRGAGLEGKVEYSSFAYVSVVKLGALTPRPRVGHLISAVDDVAIQAAVAAGARFLSVKAAALNAEMMAAGRAAGLEVGAWGVDDDSLPGQDDRARRGRLHHQLARPSPAPGLAEHAPQVLADLLAGGKPHPGQALGYTPRSGPACPGGRGAVAGGGW